MPANGWNLPGASRSDAGRPRPVRDRRCGWSVCGPRAGVRQWTGGQSMRGRCSMRGRTGVRSPQHRVRVAAGQRHRYSRAGRHDRSFPHRFPCGKSRESPGKHTRCQRFVKSSERSQTRFRGGESCPGACEPLATCYGNDRRRAAFTHIAPESTHGAASCSNNRRSAAEHRSVERQGCGPRPAAT